MNTKQHVLSARFSEEERAQIESSLGDGKASDFIRESVLLRVKNGSPIEQVLKKLDAIYRLLEKKEKAE